ncbi:MAG: hypothetical protein ABS98_06395 [Lysobacteraceae bacterium SCN 69-48]|nr:MAG: hypothetical protein ABS98_06395 [Xanthomonadaceae bacterium SCN 69-48]
MLWRLTCRFLRLELAKERLDRRQSGLPSPLIFDIGQARLTLGSQLDHVAIDVHTELVAFGGQLHPLLPERVDLLLQAWHVFGDLRDLVMFAAQGS